MMFETFFLSREPVRNPLVAEVLTVGHHLGDGTWCGGTISVRYGHRMLITGQGVNLCHLKVQDLVEVADYDPVRKVALVLGPTQPSPTTPLHWFLYARRDVQAAIQIFDDEEPASGERGYGDDLTEVKKVMGALQNAAVVNLGDSCLAVGSSIMQALEGVKCA